MSQQLTLGRDEPTKFICIRCGARIEVWAVGWRIDRAAFLCGHCMAGRPPPATWPRDSPYDPDTAEIPL